MNKNDEPIEYVRGFTKFLGCKIDLSKKPLIPRPETEFWVKKAIQLINLSNHDTSRSRIIVIADIFSGSGCIGLAVLKHIKNCEVIFADNDKNAIDQIKINLKQKKFLIRANKTIVVESDVFKNINKKIKFDYIFANPPYIPTKNKHLIQKSVLNFEPKQALFAGQDGMFYIKIFLKQAKNYLNPEGQIFMEFSPEQKSEIDKILEKLKYKSWKFNKDQFGKYRWLSMFRYI